MELVQTKDENNCKHNLLLGMIWTYLDSESPRGLFGMVWKCLDWKFPQDPGGLLLRIMEMVVGVGGRGQKYNTLKFRLRLSLIAPYCPCVVPSW